jgi:hypothetical protein
MIADQAIISRRHRRTPHFMDRSTFLKFKNFDLEKETKRTSSRKKASFTATTRSLLGPCMHSLLIDSFGNAAVGGSYSSWTPSRYFKLRAAPSSSTNRFKSPSPSDHSPTGLRSSIDWHHLPENPTALQGPKNVTEQEFLGPRATRSHVSYSKIRKNGDYSRDPGIISSFSRSFKEWFPST